MLRKIIITIVLIVLFILALVVSINVYKPKPTEYNQLLLKIDSLDNKIDSLDRQKEILITTIDSTKQNITNIYTTYEKKHSTILSQPIDSDCMFFTNYLSENFK